MVLLGLPGGVRVDLYQQSPATEEWITLLCAEEDGFVEGRLQAGEFVRLVVVLPADREDLVVFRIQKEADKTRPVRSREKTTPGVQLRRGERAYALDIAIGDTDQGALFVDHHQSTLRIAHLEAGQLHLYEVGLLCQAGQLFLAAEESFRAACCRHGSSVVIPELERWETLREFVGAQFVKLIPDLPEQQLRASGPRGEEVQLPTQKGRARVESFRLFQGWGFARRRNGTRARIHWKGYRRGRAPRLVRPRPGDLIAYRDGTSGQRDGERDTPELRDWEVISK